MNEWDVFYKGCYNDDGSLFFPERLTHEFLVSAKKHMGSQFFANQYLNVVMDESSKPFKKQWLRYYDHIPEGSIRYAFIDPAISQADTADFTAVAIVAVDHTKQWYLEHSSKHKITPTKIMDLLFQINERFSPQRIGIEDVAFQKVLLYMAYEEMQRRNVVLPLEGVKPPNDKTKQMKILGLIPRFEWGRIEINRGLYDFEQEYIEYAGERSKHDDLLDSLASIEALISYPDEKTEQLKEVPPNHPDYERWYRHKLTLGNNTKAPREE